MFLINNRSLFLNQNTIKKNNHSQILIVIFQKFIIACHLKIYFISYSYKIFSQKINHQAYFLFIFVRFFWVRPSYKISQVVYMLI